MSLTFRKIRGHDRIVQALQAAVERKSIAHAYLFEGPDGVGKEQVAWTLFATLQCARQGTEPCGECPGCRKVEAKGHPDVRVLEPEGPARLIKIDAVRELTRVLAYPPIEGKAKCVLVREADRFNEAAGNALLKTLEEPSSSTVFVLLTARPHLLLTTILSRCQRLPFHALSREVVASLLVEMGHAAPEVADTVAGIADGSIGRALELVDPELLERRARWFERLGRLDRADANERMDLAQDMAASRDEFLSLLDLFRLYFRDMLVLSVGGPDEIVANRDHLAAIGPRAQGIGPDGLLSAIDAIDEAGASIRVNTNTRLAAETLLHRLAHLSPARGAR
jgi:DNA polymerase-3 subunit delta'